MTVTNKQLQTLGIVAAVLLVLTVVLYQTGGGPSREFVRGTPLVQGLALKDVHAIKVREGDKAVTLERAGKGFTVKEKGGYPASTKDVNELITKVFGIQLAEEVTRNAENHAELNVANDSKEGTAVTLIDADGKDILTVLVGKSVGRGTGNYVRLIKGGIAEAKDDGKEAASASPDADIVYASEKSLYLSTSPTT